MDARVKDLGLVKWRLVYQKIDANVFLMYVPKTAPHPAWFGELCTMKPLRIQS